MNGIICVYKPREFTSFDIVAIMRKLTGIKKIGHGGTLDPMAEGVLPLFIGGATKAVDFLPPHLNDKGYYAGFKLGLTTDTQDIWGKVLSENNTYVSRNKIIIAGRFKGEIEQIPPMYSAVSVGGARLYDLARQGIEIERKPRKITIHEIAVEDYNDMTGFLRVKCSKGTYIRTLIHDIGQALEVGAVMTSLVRTASCGFSLDDCHSLATLKEKTPEEIKAMLTPIERVYSYYPRITLDETQTRLFKNGAALDASRLNCDTDCGVIYSVYTHDDFFTAIAEISDFGTLRVIQRFKQEL